MAPEKIKLPVNLSVLILFGLILLSLQLMSSAMQESSQLSAMYSWLLLVQCPGFCRAADSGRGQYLFLDSAHKKT